MLGEARTAAIENARVRAEQYAAAAGTEVGEILRIVEALGAGAVLRRRIRRRRGRTRRRVAIEPGTQDLAADVTVVFAMG